MKSPTNQLVTQSTPTIDDMFELMEQKFQDSFSISPQVDSETENHRKNLPNLKNQTILGNHSNFIPNTQPVPQNATNQSSNVLTSSTDKTQQYIFLNLNTKQKQVYQSPAKRLQFKPSSSQRIQHNHQSSKGQVGQSLQYSPQSQKNQHKNQQINGQKSASILDYRQLQQKIDTALRKNTKNYKNLSKATISSTQMFGLTSSQVDSNCSFDNSLMLSRFEQYQKKRQKQIQRKKLQLELREQKQLKFKPKINKKSQKIIEEIGHQGIEHRYEKILEKKNKRLEQYEELKKLKQQKEHEQFLEQFKKFQKRRDQIKDLRSYDQFYEEMLKWKEKAKKAVEEKKKMLEDKQLKQTHKFTPKISKKSEQILMKSAKIQKRLPIHQRQIPSQKRYKSKFDEECTFKPKINIRREK